MWNKIRIEADLVVHVYDVWQIWNIIGLTGAVESGDYSVDVFEQSEQW